MTHNTVTTLKRPAGTEHGRPWPPVLAVCGHSNSGKTTLIEDLVSHLASRGLAVGCVKHSYHVMGLDMAGKDTRRLFEAGAHVVGQDPEQMFVRRHAPGSAGDAVRAFGAAVDLVIIEGHKPSPHPKLWLLCPTEHKPPDDMANVVAVLPRGEARSRQALAIVEQWLEEQHRRLPLAAGILIGGKSQRMGQPKTLLPLEDGVLLDHVIAVAKRVAPTVVLLGSGALPASASSSPQLPDVPGASGPLAGILAAFRWGPGHRWLILPCDLPHLDEAALRMLLGAARPGRWAVLPKLPGAARPEPLGALFEPAMAPLFEAALTRPNQSPWFAIDHAPVEVVPVEGPQARAWCGVNTPEEWAEARGDPEAPRHAV